MRPSRFLSFVVILLVMPSAALADDRLIAQADALFEQGRRAADAGDYAVACAKFDASRRIDPAPGTVLNLADCEQARGELARAWRDFIDLADTLPSGDPHKAVALVRAFALERSMPRLRVRLTKSSEHAVVQRDGRPLGDAALGLALPVDPGSHVIVVSESGHESRRYLVEVAPGEEKDVQIAPGPSHGHDAKRSLAVGLLTAGLGALTAGTATGIFAVADWVDGPAQASRASAFGTATGVTFGIGAALTVAGVVLLVTHGHDAR